jgi:hypothetical protein
MECALIRHRSSSALIAWNTIALACTRRMGRCFFTRFFLQPLRVQGWQLSLSLRCCLSVRVVKDQSLYPVVLRFAHASAEAVLLGFDAPLGGFAGSLLRCSNYTRMNNESNTRMHFFLVSLSHRDW